VPALCRGRLDPKKERAMSDWARLDGHEVVPLPSGTYPRGNIEDRRVALTQIAPSVRVSTVFLALDHGWGGKRLWFETMVFSGPLADECERYETWDEAETGHAAMVERVKAAIAAEMEASCPS
jgi:hypothetical protein